MVIEKRDFPVRGVQIYILKKIGQRDEVLHSGSRPGLTKAFVNLKSNLALLSIEGHNYLKSVFPSSSLH